MCTHWLFGGGVGALAMVFACPCPANAEGNQVVATIDRPAVVTAVASSSVTARPADQPARLIVKITGYQPPPNGAVLAVVKFQGEGAGPDWEIGRFGVFPTTPFTRLDTSRAQTFSLPLPKELANRKALKLSVQLEPIRGSGTGASLEVGCAEIR
jgi:hypothetical protein